MRRFGGEIGGILGGIRGTICGKFEDVLGKLSEKFWGIYKKIQGNCRGTEGVLGVHLEKKISFFGGETRVKLGVKG